jgi:hypothetical protein
MTEAPRCPKHSCPMAWAGRRAERNRETGALLKFVLYCCPKPGCSRTDEIQERPAEPGIGEIAA